MRPVRPLRLGLALALLMGIICPALALDPRPPATSYLRTTFTTEDGLGANVINEHSSAIPGGFPMDRQL